MLSLKAQVYDAANKMTTNPRLKRSANVNELIFEEEEVNDVYLQGYEANVHEQDIDTPVDELMVMQADISSSKTQGSQMRPVRMDFQTWKSLTKDEQQAWDKISDKSKLAIYEYGAKRRMGKQTNGPNPSQGFRRLANAHDITSQEEWSAAIDTELQAVGLETNKHERETHKMEEK